MVLARCLAQYEASTSGRVTDAGPHPAGRHAQRHSGCVGFGRRQGRGPVPCRVTNVGEEMRVKEIWDRIEADYIEESQYQIPNPELGPLERRVGLTYEDALFSEDISVKDTEYWFSEPEGGWNQEPKRIPKAEIVPNEWATPEHFGEGRTPLADLRDGQELVGTVFRQMLYHGAQIDIGAEYDGLVPIKQEQWMPEVCQALWLDTEVRVRVHRVHDVELHRFPLQLELLEPESVANLLTHPSEHHVAMDLRGQSDMRKLEEVTGRKYKPLKYWANFDPSDAKLVFDDLGISAEEKQQLRDMTEPEIDPVVRARISALVAASS